VILIGKLIYDKLSSRYELNLEDFIAPRLRGSTLFEFTVGVLLSQNTSDENAWRAYRALVEAIGELTPSRVLELGIQEISALIKPAGMQHQRALKIVELARAFIERNIESNVELTIREHGVEAARRFLMELPGIGPKTADVVLLMWFNAPTFPVDTHIARITLRMGFVSRRDYEEIRGFWMSNTPIDLYLPLHLLLITHGRETCRARRPLCSVCIVGDYCRYYRGS
jgi:endonuclease-3